MKKKKGNEIRYAKYGYIFAIPFVIAYLIFQLYPILYTIVIGFTDLQGVNAKEIHFLAQPFDERLAEDEHYDQRCYYRHSGAERYVLEHSCSRQIECFVQPSE